MRGRVFISVLLGLSLLALPAFGHRPPREHQAREAPGKPDPPGVERGRPSNDGSGMTAAAAKVAVEKAAHSRAPGNGFGKINNAMGQKLLGRSTASMRTSFNEAGEDSGMNKTAAQAAIAKAAHSRAPGNGVFGKVNNAKGQKLLGRATASMRTSFNEAGEDNGMNKNAAQAVVFKAAHSRAPGYASNPDKINNAKGKNLVGRAMPSNRMACNEADECSMGNTGVKAEWQKAEKRSHHP